MIQITKSASNTFICTATELQDSAYSYYLIRFVSEAANTETSCIVTDTSSYSARYNSFTVLETTNPTNTSGQVELSVGIWVYEIYGQSSASNLTYTDATQLLERGLVKVTGTATDTFTQPSYSDTFTWKS